MALTKFCQAYFARGKAKAYLVHIIEARVYKYAPCENENGGEMLYVAFCGVGAGDDV